jgi:hypothetical protein
MTSYVDIMTLKNLIGVRLSKCHGLLPVNNSLNRRMELTQQTSEFTPFDQFIDESDRSSFSKHETMAKVPGYRNVLIVMPLNVDSNYAVFPYRYVHF